MDQEDVPAQFQSIKPRRIPFYQKRRELELKYRIKKDETQVSPGLTDGEKLFQESLNNASKERKTI